MGDLSAKDPWPGPTVSPSFERALRFQLGQRADDSVGPYAAELRLTVAGRVDPDGEDTQFLRLRDVPFEIVPCHPDIGRRDCKALQRQFVDSSVGFSKSHFSLDQYGIDKGAKAEFIALPALGPAIAVGQQSKAASVRAKPLHGFQSIGKDFKRCFPPVVIGAADNRRQLAALQSEIFQG